LISSMGFFVLFCFFFNFVKSKANFSPKNSKIS
jgi:hypothetical protein